MIVKVIDGSPSSEYILDWKATEQYITCVIMKSLGQRNCDRVYPRLYSGILQSVGEP